eukprot:TRINITY_DN12203_c0_g1_i1.p1 TRINITY_DN12203_c0_g1~~TRINITY_DN12203_c0_g1_i1.p1  ORF type:complete len:110 (-),score=24.24 TRINITY_DN12203_c0_g1_i1:203-532(-)
MVTMSFVSGQPCAAILFVDRFLDGDRDALHVFTLDKKNMCMIRERDVFLGSALLSLHIIRVSDWVGSGMGLIETQMDSFFPFSVLVEDYSRDGESCRMSFDFDGPFLGE